MKNSAIFVISAILVGALAVAAYTMSNKPAPSTEAEQTQQSAADALNGTEPAAGAMDQVQQPAAEAAPEATPAAAEAGAAADQAAAASDDAAKAADAAKDAATTADKAADTASDAADTAKDAADKAEETK